ncbi:MAG: hypothetical protein K6C08_13635 [Oscillospiraceae bacterium]|nr:hypothetical protein [Oscillospiraceae bacterium]
MSKKSVFDRYFGCVLLFSVSLTALSGCTLSFPEKESPSPTAIQQYISDYVFGEELLALTDSEEDAKKLAELYGISLVSFSDGVATFHTEEDPEIIVQTGTDKGWPPVEVNYAVETMS